ncbi:hypothetical protein FKG94_21475 [Exilibacterium tricleocarpae]|uniref:Uncharacterized protein n=1 Tax=Exilibacterium tricleocarpae TaxID=2591008 RepID=A0A545T045_9GAMM|nr:hypothetical protein [Exilibacterium tricleocarpae]TQV70592.1 hypothetical protein FKG94_21475 [Exilibacterium tricleocarpae]
MQQFFGREVFREAQAAPCAVFIKKKVWNIFHSFSFYSYSDSRFAKINNQREVQALRKVLNGEATSAEYTGRVDKIVLPLKQVRMAYLLTCMAIWLGY